MIYFVTLRAYDCTINLYVHIQRKLIPYIVNEVLIRHWILVFKNYIYTYIHVYVCMCIYTYIYIYVYVYICVCVFVCVYIYIYIYIYIYTHIYAHVLTIQYKMTFSLNF
jgi:hypothetical protein